MYSDSVANDVVENFTSNIGDANNTTDLRRILEETIVSLGYRYFAYHIIQHSALYEGGSARQTVGIFNYPEDWMETYISKTYVNQDPVVELGLTRKTPFRWQDELDVNLLPAKQAQVLTEAAKAGIQRGLTIPLVSRHGEIAILTVIPQQGAVDSKRQKRNENLLFVLAQFFHTRALRIVMEERLVSNFGRRRSFLSARERETTLWVSRGKSSWEIAQILGISEKSVEFYMESVKKKLEAVNRTQAVVKAILLGLIDGEHGIPAKVKSARSTIAASAMAVVS